MLLDLLEPDLLRWQISCVLASYVLDSVSIGLWTLGSPILRIATRRELILAGQPRCRLRAIHLIVDALARRLKITENLWFLDLIKHLDYDRVTLVQIIFRLLCILTVWYLDNRVDSALE